MSREKQQGKVYLIGAGPGDPDLITVKGLRCLRRADVVLYDRLVCPELLEEASPEAQLVFVGKGPGMCMMSQEEINAHLISYAEQGQTVARLKGGDPFVFGRGGEEAQALAAAGIPFEIVPGVSSAIAVPAYGGIPVTHRDYASSITIVTGHQGTTHALHEVNWQALAEVGGTLVILMGTKALPQLTQHLLAHGMARKTPAAVIQEGTTERQRMVTGTLIDIAEKVAAAGLHSPAITIIGAVAALSHTLDWYHTAQRAAALP